MDVEEVNWVKSGEHRLPILELLADKPHLPSELADELGLHRSSVSRILSDLKGRGLVDHVAGDTRTKTYWITQAGESVLADIRG